MKNAGPEVRASHSSTGSVGPHSQCRTSQVGALLGLTYIFEFHPPFPHVAKVPSTHRNIPRGGPTHGMVRFDMAYHVTSPHIMSYHIRSLSHHVASGQQPRHVLSHTIPYHPIMNHTIPYHPIGQKPGHVLGHDHRPIRCWFHRCQRTKRHPSAEPRPDRGMEGLVR